MPIVGSDYKGSNMGFFVCLCNHMIYSGAINSNASRDGAIKINHTRPGVIQQGLLLPVANGRNVYSFV